MGSISASKTFAAGQMSEMGRYDVPCEVSLPGFGIGMTIEDIQIAGILEELTESLNSAMRYAVAVGSKCFKWKMLSLSGLNYRPISVLSFFLKVVYKIVYNHVIDFIDTNNLLSKQQFGCRKNHSTNHAVITLIDIISAALDSGRAVVGCYIDLKKAFDTVNHRILIKKLQLYGIRGHILDWFRSYLQNRKQYIHINDTNSNLGSISCGAPTIHIIY